MARGSNRWLLTKVSDELHYKVRLHGWDVLVECATNSVQPNFLRLTIRTAQVTVVGSDHEMQMRWWIEAAHVLGQPPSDGRVRSDLDTVAVGLLLRCCKK